MSKTVTYNGKEYDRTSTLFTDLHDEGLNRDQAIITAVQAGVTLNTATKHYAAWAKENGLTTQIVSHKAEALEFLAKKYKGKFTIDSAREAQPLIEDEFGVAESTARDYAKAYCEQIGIEYPVVNPREAIFKWFEKAVNPTKEEFTIFCKKELNRSDSNINEYWKGYELHLYLTGATTEA
jgi:hypothetical protein